MIKVYKGIKILDKPAGKLKRNEKKLTPDELLLYDFIEKDLKIKLKPSSSPSKDAKKFWKDRLKR